jgi:hypothetical protein
VALGLNEGDDLAMQLRIPQHQHMGAQDLRFASQGLRFQADCGVLNLPRKGIDMPPEAVALGGGVRDPRGRGRPWADVVLEQVQLPNGETRGNGITLKSLRAHGPRLKRPPLSHSRRR